MTELMRRIIITISLFLIATTVYSRAQSKDFIPVNVEDIKKNPQVFWAKGIVFRAVLDEIPKSRVVKIDGRDVIQFKTKELGDVYAELIVAEEIKNLELGEEYLFSGVIGQTKRTFFGGGGDYFAIIQKVAKPIADGSLARKSIADLKLKDTTNIYNMVFITLDQIMRAVEKDMFATVNSQGLTVQQMFDPGKPQLDKMKTSVRKILREVEENSKLPLEEYFVSLIISIMALQHGYVEQANEEFHPDDITAEESSSAITDQDLEIIDSKVTKDDWDLSEKPATVPEVMETFAAEAAAADASAEAVTQEAVVEEQSVPEVVEDVVPEPEAEPVESPDVNSSESVMPSEMTEVSDAGADSPTADPVASIEVVPEAVIAVEDVHVEAAGTEEADATVSHEVADEEMWGVSATPVAINDEIPAKSEPVASSTETIVETSEVNVEIPAEPVIEETTEIVDSPVAAEIATEPAQEEKPPVKKPAKKKKSEKKKQVEEITPDVAPVTNSPQDEIDYVKPMRVR